jgi:hypothetical protein
MLGMKKAALAGVLALGTATTAQAVTFTPNVNDAFTFTLQWDDKDTIDASHFFGIGFDFDLTIESVTGANALVGFVVEDSAGNLIDTPAMDSRCADGSPTGAECELIFSSQYSGIDLASGLSAGSYNFGIFAGTALAGGSITFGVSKIAAVPLPAGGLMLLGALGALGLKRRRKAS